MLQKLYPGVSLLVAVLATAWLWKWNSTSLEAPHFIRGRNNTILFLTSEQAGLVNVHVATVFALVENHPEVEIHYASFPELANKVNKVSDAARAKNPSSNPVKWYELPGPDVAQSFWRIFGGPNGLVEDPGAHGMAKKVTDFSALITSWTAEEHWAIYERMLNLIDEVDPSLVVIDHVFKPATDLPGNVNRRFVTISPNSLLDLIPDRQPWGGMFWKYPATASGYPFPVPWHLIPSNIYINLRIIYGILTVPGMNTIRGFLRGKGVKDPMTFGLYPKSTQLLATTVPEVNLPMDFIPPEISFYGPIVLETEAASKQDGELMKWLASSDDKTVLVNLGSIYHYSESRARLLAEALAQVLERVKDSRVVWKFRKEGDYDDVKALHSLDPFIRQRRIQVVPWLEVDPSSLLESGHIDLFVHHGGGNSYHEAIFAGIPQVTLPLWFDCYNFANTAEQLGIGIWPGRKTAPDWEPDTISDGITRALIGEESLSLRLKSKTLGEKARSYGGRNAAAKEVARLAAY